MAAVIGVFGLRGRGGALGPLEVGILYAFVNYISRVTEPLTQITMQFSQLQQAMAGAARVQVLLGSRIAAGRRPRPRDARRHRHRHRGPVLHGLDLQIAPRSFHGIVGHTGSGKSTLLALLLRFYPAPVPAAAARGGRSAQEHFRTR